MCGCQEIEVDKTTTAKNYDTSIQYRLVAFLKYIFFLLRTFTKTRKHNRN